MTTIPTTEYNIDIMLEQLMQDPDRETDFQDRFLESTESKNQYNLLEIRQCADKTNDPDALQYFAAKKLFRKGYALCLRIPRTLDEDKLEKFNNEVKIASETLVDAWLLDDRAVSMSERILILGQQYETVLLKGVAKEKRENFYVKYSLLFSAWILMVGKQYKHCITTLSLAIEKYKQELPVRVYFLRALAYLALGKVRLCTDDLGYTLNNPAYLPSFFVLGSIYMSMDSHQDFAALCFKSYVEKGYPDSHDMVQALYALSVLYHNKNNITVAENYYWMATKSEEKFQKLYGTHTGLSDVKRDAIMIHETKQEAQKLLSIYAPNLHCDPDIKQTTLANPINRYPSQNQCSHCAKNQLDAPLLACSACKSIWYCSRDCQVADYKTSHKIQCKQLLAAKETETTTRS